MTSGFNEWSGIVRRVCFLTISTVCLSPSPFAAFAAGCPTEALPFEPSPADVTLALDFGLLALPFSVVTFEDFLLIAFD
jgi:hypothetical protein